MLSQNIEKYSGASIVIRFVWDQENSLSQDVLPDIDEFPEYKVGYGEEVTGIYMRTSVDEYKKYN